MGAGVGGDGNVRRPARGCAWRERSAGDGGGSRLLVEIDHNDGREDRRRHHGERCPSASSQGEPPASRVAGDFSAARRSTQRLLDRSLPCAAWPASFLSQASRSASHASGDTPASASASSRGTPASRAGSTTQRTRRGSSAWGGLLAGTVGDDTLDRPGSRRSPTRGAGDGMRTDDRRRHEGRSAAMEGEGARPSSRRWTSRTSQGGIFSGAQASISRGRSCAG